MIAQYEKNILQFLVKKNVLTLVQAKHIMQNLLQVRQSQPATNIIMFLLQQSYITPIMAQKLQEMLLANSKRTGQMPQMTRQQPQVDFSHTVVDHNIAVSTGQTAVDFNVPKSNTDQTTVGSSTGQMSQMDSSKTILDSPGQRSQVNSNQTIIDSPEDQIKKDQMIARYSTGQMSKMDSNSTGQMSKMDSNKMTMGSSGQKISMNEGQTILDSAEQQMNPDQTLVAPTTGQMPQMSRANFEQTPQINLEQTGIDPGDRISKEITSYVEETAYPSSPAGANEQIGNSQLGKVDDSQLGNINSATQSFRVSQLDESNGQKMFGHYRIERELGRGGMGLVLLVYDTQLDREVALKVIINEQNISEEQIRRFSLEARATAKLKHPNIVEVYEAGSRPKNYFTMEHIKGKPFSNLIQKGNLDSKTIAAIMKKSCDAIYYAYKEHKIIHRDIKPSNIMMNGKEPKIMDFGLAKEMDRDEQLSQGGGMMGTLGYMPPEQVDNDNVGHHSDVYALGATLYNALTGRPPFQGGSYYVILNQIHNSDPIPPSQLAPGISKELEAICLKCLQKKPRNRYRNAGELSDDLSNFLYNRPVFAKPPSLPAKAYKWYKRNKLKTLVSFTFLVSLLSVTSIVIWNNASLQKANVEIQREKVKVEKARNYANNQKSEAIDQLIEAMESKWFSVVKQYQLTIMAGQNSAEKNKREATQKHLDDFNKEEERYVSMLSEAGKKDYFSELLQRISINSPIYPHLKRKKQQKEVYGRGWEWKWLKTIAKQKIKEQFNHSSKVISCVYHPKNEQVICGDTQGNIFSVKLPLSENKPRYIWQSQLYNSNAKIRGYDSKRYVAKLAISPNAQYLLSYAGDRRLLLWDLRKNEIIGQYLHFIPGDHKKERPLRISAFAFTKNSQNVVIGYDKSNTDEAFQTFNRKQKLLPRFANALVWSVKNDKKPRHKFFLFLNKEKGDGVDHSVTSIDLSNDGKTLAVGRINIFIPVVLIDLKSKKERILKGPKGQVMSTIFSTDGRYVISGDESGYVSIWNVKTGKLIRQFLANDGKVRRCVINDNILITVGSDNQVKLWDLNKIGLKNMLMITLSEQQVGDIFIDRAQQKIIFEQATMHLDSISIDFIRTPLQFPGSEIDHRYVEFHPQDSNSVICTTKYKFFAWKLDKEPIPLSLLRTTNINFHKKNNLLGVSLEGQKSTLFVKFDKETSAVERLKSIGLADPNISMVIASPKKPNCVTFHPRENKALVGLNYNRDSVKKLKFPDGSVLGLEVLFFYDVQSQKPQKLWSGYFKREVDVTEVSNDARQMLVLSHDQLFIKSFSSVAKDIENNQKHYGNLYKDFRERGKNGKKTKRFLLQQDFRFSKELVEDKIIAMYACFSPDSKYIAVAAQGPYNLVILDAQSLEIVAKLKDHLDYVTCCQFSPDGTRLVSCSRDKTVRIWDVENLTKREERNSLLTLRKHISTPRYCAFSSDGKNIASCGGEELFIWKTK